MGLLGKLRNGWNNMKNNIHQGIQGAKNFAGKVWDATKQGISKVGNFVYENREHIGNALKAASPFIGAVNPALGLAASAGGSFLSGLKSGPVKSILIDVSRKAADGELTTSNKRRDENYTAESNAQEGVERKRKRKKARIMTQL